MAKKIVASGPIFIVVAAFLWGLDGILRRSLFTLPPTIIVFYEHFLGALLILPLTVKALRQEKVSRETWGALLWVSLLSGLLGTLMFTAALVKINFISFSVVFLLQKLQPIFAIIAAAILLKEKISRPFVGWAILALAAAYFVTFPLGQVNLATGTGTITAALLAVGAAFAWGSSTAVSRFGLLRLSHTLMTGLRFLLTTPLALVAVFLLKNQASLTGLTPDHFLRLLAIAVSTGMVALWLYYRGLKYTQVKVTTILELVFPLTAVFIDVALYKNVLHSSQYLAALILLFAVFKVSQLNKAS
ncbi:MAG: DMT family transporter [Candidatus Chisholmbacteria bacterium]|nr:DMT family transporter [Candidatus Chisholmbacteria bacterium]